ncbi:Uncharacterised protein [Mycobacteroides abscessus subsp. abscessus]|uniref:hypothetical protein n=1 Tax=Mycobacteroides abscessus TaxID=36809 RepID=UPI00092B2DF3|nr:hypothetical protein [Mycobacteroides abscessus]SHV18274.1 Uncharacterised protein [Mycobacteroides abscessus subsp. abscessus]
MTNKKRRTWERVGAALVLAPFALFIFLLAGSVASLVFHRTSGDEQFDFMADLAESMGSSTKWLMLVSLAAGVGVLMWTNHRAKTAEEAANREALEVLAVKPSSGTRYPIIISFGKAKGDLLPNAAVVHTEQGKILATRRGFSATSARQRAEQWCAANLKAGNVVITGRQVGAGAGGG